MHLFLAFGRVSRIDGLEYANQIPLLLLLGLVENLVFAVRIAANIVSAVSRSDLSKKVILNFNNLILHLKSFVPVYFDVEDMNEPITIMMNMSREHTARLWEIKVSRPLFFSVFI